METITNPDTRLYLINRLHHQPGESSPFSPALLALSQSLVCVLLLTNSSVLATRESLSERMLQNSPCCL